MPGSITVMSSIPRITVCHKKAYSLEYYSHTCADYRETDRATMPSLSPNVTLRPDGDQVHTDFLRACGEGQRASRLAYLLNNGANIEHRDNKSCTPLHHAAFGGSEDTVRYLLDVGADVQAVATWCGSALCLAALKRHKIIVEILLAYGAKVNRVCPMLGSAAHAACVGGDMAVVRTLYQAGANFTAKAETCMDAYDDLVASDVEAIIELNKDCRIRWPELRFQYASASVSAVERGFCEAVEFFLALPDGLSINEEFMTVHLTMLPIGTLQDCTCARPLSL